MSLLLAVGLTLTVPAPVAAQMVREHDVTALRSFHGPASRIRRSFKSDSEALSVLRQVLAAAGLAGMEDRIIIRASAETDNAEAFIEKDERLIFYNAVFMQGIAAKTKDYWSMVAILAHEVGHHIRFHTVIPGRDHEFELEADYQAGFILRRLGARLDQAQAVFNTFSDKATQSHPGRAQRVQAVTLGWTDGGTKLTPDWVKPVVAVPPVVVPQPVPPAPARCDGVEAQVGSERRCLKPKDTFKDCPECPEMVVIPAGEFTMGSPPDEAERGWDEGPQRKVTIARPFAVGKFEVTFAEWAACAAAGGCKHKPEDAGWGRGKRPVINVSWDDAIKEYLPWLNRESGRTTYRLLSEAEWEYAARARSSHRYTWGDEVGRNLANCGRCGSQWDDKQTAPAGSFKANAFGLHDVHGNVWEWVEDCWHGSYTGAPTDGTAKSSASCTSRVLRGGSWNYYTGALRSARRLVNSPVLRDDFIGFRVARTL